MISGSGSVVCFNGRELDRIGQYFGGWVIRTIRTVLGGSEWYKWHTTSGGLNVTNVTVL